MANKCIKCTGRSEALISLVTVNIAVKDLLKHNIEVYMYMHINKQSWCQL